MLFAKILIGFLLSVLLIVLFLLVIKIKITVILKNGEQKVLIKLLFFELTVYPNFFTKKVKKKPVPEKEITQEDKPKETHKQKNKIDFSELSDFILKLLHEFENAIVIDTMLITLVLATSNAATTGLLLGQVSAVVGCIMPYLYSHFTIKQKSIVIDADFNSDKSRWDVLLVVYTRGIKILLILKRNYKKIMEFIKKTKES